MAQRPFRIFALPLARLPRPTPAAAPRNTRPASPESSPKSSNENAENQNQNHHQDHPLILFQVSQPDPSAPSAETSKWTLSALANRGLNGAQDQWMKLSTKKKDGWMYWFYAKGEGLMDKIEFEEWMLKGVHEGRGVEVRGKESGEKQEVIEISLLRPDLPIGPPLPPLLPKLHRMLIHRIPHHRKMMWRSLIFSPFTFPFAIIPVLPNFPLFYVLWRAWSHYRAWRGAHYLEQLVQLGMIKETPSKELTKVYASSGTPNTQARSQEGIENHSPDETSSAGLKAGTTSPNSTTDAGKEEIQGKAAQISQMNPQEKGEKTGSGDTTATPDSMVYTPAPKTPTPDSMVYERTSMSETISTPEGDAPATAKSGKKHESLLLSPAQIPVLKEMFDLRPGEVLDITRAVEQADLRAKAIDRRNGGGPK